MLSTEPPQQETQATEAALEPTDQPAASPTTTPIQPTQTPIPATQTEMIDIFSFNIVDENGTAFDLAAYQGKPLMLIFFSIHCGHCHNEAEHLDDLYERYHDQINIVALEVSGASNEEIVQFASDYDLLFPVTADASMELTQAMGITGVPTNLLIASDGSLYGSLRGYRELDIFTEAIDQMLASEED
ncbi:MAG TPA: TlpA disulfide reductase family protein [Desulfatirhabdiaceae bacterium]|nr:TlpA disulfide reductase family protein [Desulfatirhabdiaceae bacterium]